MDYCVKQVLSNPTLALFDKNTLVSFLDFVESAPTLDDAIIECLK